MPVGTQQTAKNEANTAPSKTPASAATAAAVFAEQQVHYNDLVSEKVPEQAVSEDDLAKIFAEYFAPNTDLYMIGTPKAASYFHAINAAKLELLNNGNLLNAAAKWEPDQYAELLKNPRPGIGNMMICGLIFKVGAFSVVKDMVYCVDFSERVPNCIALYLLLIAQKMPEDKRTFVLDAGSGTDRTKLMQAIRSLSVCDPKWECKIW